MATKRTAQEEKEQFAAEGFENMPAKPDDDAVASRSYNFNRDGVVTEMNAEQLKELTIDQLSEMFGVTDATEAIGTDQWGPIIEDKQQLVGKPFVIVHFTENPGDFGRSFVSLMILTNDNNRFIVNDGSTGIRNQLVALKEKSGTDSMILCKHGFRVSEYDYDLPDGNTSRARTYYVDTKL